MHDHALTTVHESKHRHLKEGRQLQYVQGLVSINLSSMSTCPHHHHEDEAASDYEEDETTDGIIASSSTTTEDLYKPYRKHSEFYVGNFLEEWLHPDMIELVKTVKKMKENKNDNSFTSVADAGGGMVDPLKKIPTNLLKEETNEIYSFNCFNDTFLTKFNDEIQHFYATCAKYKIPIDRPNSMNNYGVILNEIGMKSFITNFQQDYLWPIARVLFPREASEQFDTNHHTFLVRYKTNEDLGLDFHTDDSDITSSICLGETNPEFTGATLQFCGTLGNKNHRQHSYTYYHKIGRAILHKGNRRHGADNIESGTRTNLIICCISSRGFITIAVCET